MTLETNEAERTAEKLPLLVERELKRLPEFGEMSLQARRRAWKDVSREVRFEWQTIALVTTVTVTSGTVLLLLLFSFARDTGWTGEVLAFGSLAVVLVPTLLLLHVFDVRRVRKRLWSRLRHLCSFCGYNLTGNTSGVCPECGREIGEQKD